MKKFYSLGAFVLISSLLAAYAVAVPIPGCVTDVFTWPAISVPKDVEVPIAGTTTLNAPLTKDISISALTGDIFCEEIGPGVQVIGSDGQIIANGACSATGWQVLELVDATGAQVSFNGALSFLGEGEGVQLSAGSFELNQCDGGCVGDNQDCASGADCSFGFNCWGGRPSTGFCSGHCYQGTGVISSADGSMCSGCRLNDITTLHGNLFVGPAVFGSRTVSTEVTSLDPGQNTVTNKVGKGLIKQLTALASNGPFDVVPGPVVISNEDGVRMTLDTWLHNQNDVNGLGQEEAIPDGKEEKEKFCIDSYYCAGIGKTVVLCSSNKCETVDDCFNKSPDPAQKNKVTKYSVTVQLRDAQSRASGTKVVGLKKCQALPDNCSPKTNGLVDCAKP